MDEPFVGGEGARVDAPTACARSNVEDLAEGVDRDEVSAIWDEDAVAAEGGWRAVEDGVCVDILPGEGPVPVGESAFEVAFFAEGCFKEVVIVAVVGKKDAVLVDERGA